jgi:hypothetical protein
MMSYVLAQDMDSSALNWYSIAQLEEYGAPCFGCKALTPPSLLIFYIVLLLFTQIVSKRHLMIQHPCPTNSSTSMMKLVDQCCTPISKRIGTLCMYISKFRCKPLYMYAKIFGSS